MRTHALVPAVLLGLALAAPPAGADGRHSDRDAHRYPSRSYVDRHHSPRGRTYVRPAPRRYAPPVRYRYAPPYRYPGPGYYYRPAPRVYYRPAYPVPVVPYGYYPAPRYYRGGVHGGVGLGVPGFGISLYF